MPISVTGMFPEEEGRVARRTEARLAALARGQRQEEPSATSTAPSVPLSGVSPMLLSLVKYLL